jgi:hypothetical protein
MPGTTPATQALVDREIAAARKEKNPERLVKLDEAYALSEKQCLAVGKALTAIVQPDEDDEDDFDDDDEDDEDEDDFDDEDDEDDDFEEDPELLRRAAVLRSIGGERWKFQIDDGDETFALGGKYPGSLSTAQTFLGEWAEWGAQLCEPVRVRLPWPTLAARRVVLGSLKGLLRDLHEALDEFPEVRDALQDIVQRVEEAAANPKAKTIGQKLRDELAPLARKMDKKERAAAKAAEEAEDDEELNRKAYAAYGTKLAIEAAIAATFTNADEGLVEVFDCKRRAIYPIHALEECLDRYYSEVYANFDELCTPDLVEKEVWQAIDQCLRAAEKACFEQCGRTPKATA